MNSKISRKLFHTAYAITICGLMSFAYQNCARAKFMIDESAKSEALGKENVFGRDGGDDGVVPGTGPGDDGSVPGTRYPQGNDGSVPRWPSTSYPPPGDDSSVPKTSVPLSFIFECSNWASEDAGGNLLTATALKVVIVNATTSAIACELSGNFRSDILNTKKIDIMPCSNLPAGKYNVYIMDVARPSANFYTQSLSDDRIIFTKNADGTYTSSNGPIDIIYDFNKSNSLYSSLNSQFGNTSTAATQALCDYNISPLVVSMGVQSRGVKLSAPLDGIQFDILGERSFPKAHDKKQISWFLETNNDYYFIVLPNKDGKVLGINEMFGDNTRGPDGKFSPNGYAALAKYDIDKDSYITPEDAIYEDLRMWNDKNRDGIADGSELFSLKGMKINVIDLKYDKRYKETDQYGNQTLMKSVVKTEDGQLHLMFDLWFRFLNITK